MNLQNYKPLFFLTVLALIAFGLHSCIFSYLTISDCKFLYSVEFLYLFFYVLSCVVFIILIKVKERSFDNVGMSFLLSTTVKMIFCYLILKPILQIKSYDNTIEKINFFMTFALFLAIETVLTIRILNEKQ